MIAKQGLICVSGSRWGALLMVLARRNTDPFLGDVPHEEAPLQTWRHSSQPARNSAGRVIA
jgi:hypothetical protein